jgi:nucleoside-diphosphate-sugar epimerase
MKVLFIGGTGTISSACSQLAVERGIDLTLFNRGSSLRPAPAGAKQLKGNIRDEAAVGVLLAGQTFDAVVDWVAYTQDQVETDLRLFRGRTGQYVFISSASVYQKPPSNLPVDESTLAANPYWQYSRDKIACEELLIHEYRQNRLPFTIVRPSHTYDQASIPLQGGYTAIDRMQRGLPVIVHGDGTSLWVLTHHDDFAKGFLGLLGNPRAIGEIFQITSDEELSWNQIYTCMAQAAGIEQPKLVHVPSDLINAFDPEWGAGLLGDKAHSMIFDNHKIKQIVPDFAAAIPFAQGAREIGRHGRLLGDDK